jgi:hypothetical protein
MGYTREFFIGFICFWVSVITVFILVNSLLYTPKMIPNNL